MREPTLVQRCSLRYLRLQLAPLWRSACPLQLCPQPHVHGQSTRGACRGVSLCLNTPGSTMPSHKAPQVLGPAGPMRTAGQGAGARRVSERHTAMTALLLAHLIGAVAFGPAGPVGCGVQGNCFNISGAKNTAPKLPSGTDLNGQYIKTSHTCNRMGVWQQGGSGGPVLYKDEYGSWDLAPSERATDCSGGGTYAASAFGSCPASPDGAGCFGKWGEYDPQFKKNPALVVVDSGGFTPPPPPPTPTPTPPTPPPVDCSAKGNCFNISGAKNTNPYMPSGTDLNGQYAKTNHTCNGKGVWQHAHQDDCTRCLQVLAQVCGAARRASAGKCYVCTGSSPHAPKLQQAGCKQQTMDGFCSGSARPPPGESGGPVLLLDGHSQWTVGPSQYATTCIGGGGYLTSDLGSCPASPDGLGCAGKWAETDSRGLNKANPALRVVAYALGAR